MPLVVWRYVCTILEVLESHGGDKHNIAIYGQERYDGTLRLCKMNLALRDLSFDVRLGDSLLNDQFPDLKADYIVVNPPFNVKTNGTRRLTHKTTLACLDRKKIYYRW